MTRHVRDVGNLVRERILYPRGLVWFLLHLIILLVGVIVTLLGNAWLQAVGASLVAVGIAGYVTYVYMAHTERFARRLDILDRFGFTQAFEGRSVRIREEYDKRCQNMTKQLDVLGFGLSSLLQDHRDDFADWKRRANVRILAIDPYFPHPEYTYADQRDTEEKNERGGIRADVQNLYKTLEPLIGSEGGKTFDVKLYRCLPSVNIFRIDDEILWGPYFMYQASRNTPTFLVTRGGLLFQRIMEHFDAIWNDPELSVPLTALDEMAGDNRS